MHFFFHWQWIREIVKTLHLIAQHQEGDCEMWSEKKYPSD